MTDQANHVREVRVGERMDTREVLLNASRQAQARNFDDVLIVDVDAHHYEGEAWMEIAKYIEDPAIRRQANPGALISGVGRAGSPAGQSMLLPGQIGNQDVAGRITRYRMRSREEWQDEGEQRDLILARRAMDAIGIDYQILFPTPMLYLGLHPVAEVEAALARAYSSWITDRVLSQEPRIKTMLYLPFNDPEASLKIVEDFGDIDGVVGFMVTSTRYRNVYENQYMKLYRAIEERGMPLGFHAGYSWLGDRRMESLNSFASVHAISFVLHNMVHLTNWVMNGLPEKFPNLNVLWIESGLAWLPFLMQRLDHEFAMRNSEAPLLKRLPSEYMRDMYFTSQPLEAPNLTALQQTFEMIDAGNQLMYASDYPHWDFDLPSRIWDLPFLDEDAKRNILGETAAKLFGLDPGVREPKIERKLATVGGAK